MRTAAVSARLPPECVRCIYFRPDRTWLTTQNQTTYGLCTHPRSVTIIDGTTGIPEYSRALNMRKDTGACRCEGVLFEDGGTREHPTFLLLVIILVLIILL